MFLYKSEKAIKEEDREFREKYGTIFEEFICDKGLKYLWFYPYFFARRLLYIFLLYNFAFNAILQVCLNISHTLLILIYISHLQPFKRKDLNYFYIIQELCILFSFILSGLFIKTWDPLTETALEYMLIAMIGITMFVSYMYAACDTIRQLRERCTRRAKITVDIATPHSFSCSIGPVKVPERSKLYVIDHTAVNDDSFSVTPRRFISEGASFSLFETRYQK